MNGEVQSKPPMDMHPPVNMVNNINGVDKPKDDHNGYQLEGGEYEGDSKPKADGETDTQSKPPTTQTLQSSNQKPPNPNGVVGYGGPPKIPSSVPGGYQP